MKTKSFLPIVLLAAGTLVACGGEPASGTPSKSGDATDTQTTSATSLAPLPQEYDLMKYWAGNPAEECYRVIEKDDSTVIRYEDVTGEAAGGWAYVGRSFAFDAADRARFGEYKKISFTGSLELTSGSDVVMVKVQGAGGTFERKFNFLAESKTYEFGLNFVTDWSQVDSLFFFVNRETSDPGNGAITLTKCVLSKDDVNPDYDIAPGMPSVPQDWNTYKGGDKFEVMYRWGYDDKEQITATEVEEGVKFAWGDVLKTEAWAYVSAKVRGDDDHPLAESGLKRITFEFQGTAGQSALFKFQDKANTNKKEETVVLDGQPQTVSIDVTSILTNAAEDSFLACIFPGPNKTGADCKGELLLTDCYLDKTDPNPSPVNVATQTEVYFDNPDHIDSIYNFSNENHVSTIAFDKTGDGWENLQFTIVMPEGSTWDIKNYKRVYGQFVSTVATKILIKPFDSNDYQQEFELAANTALTVDFTLENTDGMALNKPMVFFIAPGNMTGKGTLTATNFKLTHLGS